MVSIIYSPSFENSSIMVLSIKPSLTLCFSVSRKETLPSSLCEVSWSFCRTSGNSNTKHGKKDTKRRKIPINDIVTHSDGNSEAESDIELMDANLDGIEFDDDETLMDTDSIFDDLLSKENDKYDSRRRQLEIRQRKH